MSMKFKVGDRVKVVGAHPYCQGYRGKVYTIHSVRYCLRWPYQLKIPGHYPMLSAEELEKVKND